MVMRADPVAGFFPVRDAITQLLSESVVRPTSPWSTAASFPFDLYEAEDELVLRAAIPGAQAESIELTVNQGVLSVKGYRAFYSGEQEKEYRWHVRGLSEGDFQLSVALPVPVDAAAAVATFEGGVLHLRLPKAELAKTRRIPVTSGARQAALDAGQTKRA
jgi:HSP20 family protein